MVNWINFPKQQQRDGGTPFLTDIVSHLPISMGNQYYSDDRVTWAHETTHGINSYIRNTFAGNNGVGFYIGDNKAAVLTQPKMTLTQIGNTIPQNLRGDRYQLYFISQAGDWNNTPLYPFDEWVAYTNGAGVGLELTNITTHSDVMIGALEFSVYAICVCLAIDKYDPGYFTQEPQFKEFVAYELKRSIGIFRKGIVMPQYEWDVVLKNNIMKNQQCIDILAKIYGTSLTLAGLFEDVPPPIPTPAPYQITFESDLPAGPCSIHVNGNIIAAIVSSDRPAGTYWLTHVDPLPPSLEKN